jgi:NDP-sugar pyrophosphorylase family protein
MKAMILAAGLGTRLAGLTANKPKALVEINGIAMLEGLILRLKSGGIHNFLINIHHYGEQIIEFLRKNRNFGVDISISDERDVLLDTGGAVKKAANFFEGTEPVLVHNVDVYSEINLNMLLEYHQEMSSLATLCVRKRTSGRALIFGKDKLLAGWVNLDKQNYKWVGKPFEKFEIWAYSGVFLAEPDFASKIPFTGTFSIIDGWLEMAKMNNITGYFDESPAWFDLGTVEKIRTVEQYLRSKKI